MYSLNSITSLERNNFKGPYKLDSVSRLAPLKVSERFKAKRGSKLTEINSDKELGSVFDGEVQAKRVHKALHSYTADVNTLIEVFGNLSQYERSRIVYHYKALFGKKLSGDMKEILGGDFEEICQNIIMEPKVYLTKKIHYILMEFPYPKEDLLISLLCERTNEEVKAIKDTYQKRFGMSLEKGLSTFLDAEGSKYLKLLVNPLRQEEISLTSLQAHLDAQNLINLGIGITYSDSFYPVIHPLIKKRSYSHLRSVFMEYYRLTGDHIWNRLEPAMPQSQKQRLIMILEAIYNPELFSANVLHSSTQIFGGFCATLLIIRLSRSKEFFRIVEHIYKELFRVKLSEEINANVSGESSTLLLKLIDI